MGEHDSPLSPHHSSPGMTFYPEKTNDVINDLRHCAESLDSGVGYVASSLICGTFVRYELMIDNEDKTVLVANFGTNACGYAVAAAELLSRQLIGKDLADLGGLDASGLREFLYERLQSVPADRSQCLDMCVDALHGAFAEYRSSRLNSYDGHEALICTCFGVAESTIEQAIASKRLSTVDEVA